MSEVRLTVHRATNQIGGNCIEIAVGDHRIVLDVGRPLYAPNYATGLLPTTVDLKAPMDGVLISHPHQDHYGLLEETPHDWPVFCGEPTKRSIQLTSGIFGEPIDRDFRPWKSGEPFEVGPFRITPHLTDHSAFDAHMLLIEAEGKPSSTRATSARTGANLPWSTASWLRRAGHRRASDGRHPPRKR